MQPLLTLQKLSYISPKWQFTRQEDYSRWWVRDKLYSERPITPMMASTWPQIWEDAVLWSAIYMTSPSSKGFSVRNLNGYSYMGPILITDESEIQKRTSIFLSFLEDYHNRLDHIIEDIRKEQMEEMSHWQAIQLDEMQLYDLINYVDRSLNTLKRFLELHFVIVFPRHVAQGSFEEECRKLLGITHPGESGKMIQASMRENRLLKLDMSMWDLADEAEKLNLKQIFLESRVSELENKLHQLPNGQLWFSHLEEFLSEFGYRQTYPYDVIDPTWIEDHTPPLAVIKGYVQQGNKYDYETKLGEMVKEREELVSQNLSKIASQADKDRFLTALKRAQKLQLMGDDDNYFLLWALANLRLTIKEAGLRLANHGTINHTEDVFFLKIDELNQILRDMHVGYYDLSFVKPLIEKRRSEWKGYFRLDPPNYLGPVPELITDWFISNFWGITGKRQLDNSPADKLIGIATFPGIVEGIARVILTTEEFKRVQPGDILVCRATSTSWSPLFSMIKALVTDQGGSLSHAAVISREYRIPAVLSTVKATNAIKDGQKIKVDGTNGVVYLL